MEGSSTPPVKPPRGIKPSKETSGLLISVIRALSASETNEQREIEKAKLEKDFKKCDARLDELVSLHETDLLEVMRIFSELSERVTAAREKIHSVKENLNACKQLLNCRREELMKLWLEGVEHKYVLQLLEDVDQLKEIPAKLSTHLEKKHYLHATQLIVTAVSLGGGVLEEVEGLREVRTEIDIKKQKLISKLLEELNKHLYKEQVKESGLRRQGSNRDFQRGIEMRSSSKGSKVKRNLLDVSSSGYASGQVSRKTSSVGLDDLNNLIEDESNLNPEENSEHFLAIIIECLALLNQIPEAIEVIKTQMQNELLKIIEQASKTVKESSDKVAPVNIKVQDVNNSELPSQSPLLDLLNVIFKRFQQVIASHSMALCGFAHVTKKHNVEVPVYEMTDVWNGIQAALQIFLTEYLDVQNMVDGSFQSTVSLNEQTNDINMYFAKKRPQRQKNGLLFKFDSSTHAISLNNYLKDHRYNSLTFADSKQSKSNKYLVCKPDPKNITLIFRPIMQFIEDVERALGIPSGSPSCTLSNFLADYVKEVYLGRHHVLVATTIETATKSADAWRATTSPEQMKDLGLMRPLLQSTVKVQQCVAELRLLMIALPLQGEHFCTLTLNVLHNYRETCQETYRSIVQPDRHDRLICSAAWLKDEDINRFIKSLPNWESMKSEEPPYYRKGPSGRRMPRRQETTDEESPEDIRLRNVREAEILASNLGEGGIAANEIISDIDKLRSLALLQESIEWLALFIRSLIKELRQSNRERNLDSNTLPPMPDPLVQCLEQVAKEYDELANTCILVLHLEVRVQCFYYLHPRGDVNLLCKGTKDPEEPDPRVEELSRVLQHIDESLQCTLHPKKSKYIFEGLGHLIAKILISSAQYIERIDTNGVQKMCRNVFTLQQTLTNITLTREQALDYARQYYELFYESPEELLSGVLEHGPQFSELEYINALQLIARSRQEYAQVNRHLEKLSEILGDVGVTV